MFVRAGLLPEPLGWVARRLLVKEPSMKRHDHSLPIARNAARVMTRDSTLLVIVSAALVLLATLSLVWGHAVDHPAPPDFPD